MTKNTPNEQSSNSMTYEIDAGGYRELHVWRDSMDLVDLVYDLTEQFPSSERFGLSIQLRKAAVSIPSNIAEGRASGSVGMYLRRVRDACGSSAEVETQLLIAQRRNYASAQTIGQLLEQLVVIRKRLFGLRRYLYNHPKR